ncbi:MAG: tRNA-dihydrouridine synthase family protein [Victivallales bacterium]|nr:tRNA-dihydrouridine synthase family protein [Victivallales bacterium]
MHSSVPDIVFASGLKFPRFFPGPMEGVMTPLFCRAFHTLGLTAGWLTPYYRLTTSLPRDKRLQDFLQPFTANGLPVIVQLMGTDALLLARGAERMARLGAAGINLNFACPSRQVIKSGAGGALLQDIPLMLEIVRKIKYLLPEFSLSVKIRCGFSSPGECEKIIPALIQTEALDFIILHFRTVTENYSGVADGADRLKRAVELAAAVPVIGSGDVFSAGDTREMLACGCAGAIVARGLLRNPFLLRELSLSSPDKLPEPETARIILFQTLQRIARTDLHLFSRSKFLEYAAMMWGGKSGLFTELKNLPPEKLLAYRFPEVSAFHPSEPGT